MKENGCVGGIWMMGKRSTYKTFVGKSEGRALHRGPHRWEHNIKMDLNKMEMEVPAELNWFRIGSSGGCS
jgi:hypothetical protein